MRAADNQPTGTTYSWAVSNGAGKVAFIGSTTGSSATLKPTTESVTQGDVTIRLTYSLEGQTATSSQTLTVHRPKAPSSSLSIGALQTYAGGLASNYTGPFANMYVTHYGGGTNIWVWGRTITYKSKSQFGRVLPDLKWDETVVGGPVSQGDGYFDSTGTCFDGWFNSRNYTWDGTNDTVSSHTQTVKIGGWHIWTNTSRATEKPDMLMPTSVVVN